VDLVARVEAALDRIEADPAAIEAVQAVVELYGEGLRRLMAGAREEDELVAHLLVLHDLHPLPVEERVRAALVPGVQLVSVDGAVVHLRMTGGCSSTGDAVKQAVAEAAPDLDEIVMTELAAPTVIGLPLAGSA
jgi:hypothetical protein